MNDAPVAMLGLTNAEAEMAVLHAMKEDVTAAIELSGLLEAEDFYDPKRAIIFEAMQRLLLGVEPLDATGIFAECQAIIGDRKLKTYVDLSTIETLTEGDIRRYEMYANTVRKLAWLRKAGEFAFWLVQELQGRPRPDALFVEAQEKWQMLAPKMQEIKFIYGWDTVQEHSDIVKDRVRTKATGARIVYGWPWASWTQRMRPLQPGFLGLLAAADGIGKTTYLEEIAEHWAANGIHVVYVHLEDNREYKFDRRLARHAKVPIERIQDGDFTEEDRVKIADANNRIESWAGYLHYLDAAGDTMTSILRELQTRIDEGICQAVVYDYLDKTQASRGQVQAFGGNVWERQANDMEQLKVFCTKNRIPAMTASQGNKTMQNNGTQTRQAIQGSGQKSQKAQLVVIVTREMVGDEGLRDGQGNVLAEAGEYSPIVKVRIDKQNIGKTGEFRQFIKGPYFTIRDLNIERRPLNEPMTAPMFDSAAAANKDH